MMGNRCWNCSRYTGCTDYRTFAWGCDCCTSHREEPSLLKTRRNLADFQWVKKQGPQKTEEEPLPEWVFSPLVKPEGF